jgi:formylglycine-generating enzyme required for sulfatase activity
MIGRISCILPAFAAVLFAISLLGADEKADVKTAKETVPASTTEIQLVQLPPGKVTIKDKDGRDKTYDVKPVWISRTEITWEQYYPFSYKRDLTKEQIAKKVDAQSRPSEPYNTPHLPWGEEGFPAGRIHELAAKKYCVWLSKKTGKKYRLPTEAEWEYACRAGGEPVKFKSNKELDPHAWFIGNSDEEPHEVAKKRPNRWGLYDMLGNLCEWVVREDGTMTTAGGSYMDEVKDVGSAARMDYDPSWQREDANDPKGTSWLSNGAFVGFRVVRED